jgi:hypothetical protein
MAMHFILDSILYSCKLRFRASLALWTSERALPGASEPYMIRWAYTAVPCISGLYEKSLSQSSPESQQRVSMAVTLNWIGECLRKKYPVLSTVLVKAGDSPV